VRAVQIRAATERMGDRSPESIVVLYAVESVDVSLAHALVDVFKELYNKADVILWCMGPEGGLEGGKYEAVSGTPMQAFLVRFVAFTSNSYGLIKFFIVH